MSTKKNTVKKKSQGKDKPNPNLDPPPFQIVTESFKPEQRTTKREHRVSKYRPT